MAFIGRTFSPITNIDPRLESRPNKIQSDTADFASGAAI